MKALFSNRLVKLIVAVLAIAVVLLSVFLVMTSSKTAVSRNGVLIFETATVEGWNVEVLSSNQTLDLTATSEDAIKIFTDRGDVIEDLEAPFKVVLAIGPESNVVESLTIKTEENTLMVFKTTSEQEFSVKFAMTFDEKRDLACFLGFALVIAVLALYFIYESTKPR